MWIFLNRAMLSVVAHRGKPHHFMVRARFEGDLERVFPKAKVLRTPNADYLFRATVTRRQVAAALALELGAVEYDNFKASVPHADADRVHAYSGVWDVMKTAQDRAAGLVPGQDLGDWRQDVGMLRDFDPDAFAHLAEDEA